jgi:rhamnosyltransferase
VGPDIDTSCSGFLERYPYASGPMPVSVVIRVRDEVGALTQLLERLARQTADHEVVVVDSGSTDGSDAAARRAGARVERVARFTFGGALNTGTAVATGDVVVALSAHAFPSADDWLARMAAAFEDPGIACAFGPDRGERLRQDRAAFDPRRTYSNGAGGFRRALWERHPFREDLPACEDVEWARWALDEGFVCLLDPALAVEHDHAHDSLRDCFVRYRREAQGYAALGEQPPYGLRDLLTEWWSARARLDPRRASRLAGKWAGSR